MDFDSIPEDLSLCEPHWSSKATAGELPSGEGSDHEARLVGVGDNYAWIDDEKLILDGQEKQVAAAEADQ